LQLIQNRLSFRALWPVLILHAHVFVRFAGPLVGGGDRGRHVQPRQASAAAVMDQTAAGAAPRLRLSAHVVN